MARKWLGRYYIGPRYLYVSMHCETTVENHSFLGKTWSMSLGLTHCVFVVGVCTTVWLEKNYTHSIGMDTVVQLFYVGIL